MKTLFKTVFLTMIIALTLLPQITAADIPPDMPVKRTTSPAKALSVRQMILLQSQVFATPEKPILLVGTCESSLNQKAVGRQGEIGIFQYKTQTWKNLEKIKGETLDIHSASDQVKMTAWVFKYHPEMRSMWTCAYLTGIL